MTFDLSHLYKRNTIRVGGLFDVTVREVPHGQLADLQADIYGELRLSSNTRNLNKQIEEKKLDVMAHKEAQSILAIESWTLKDAVGADVPVSLEAWRELPAKMADTINEAIEELNPTPGEDFPG